MCFQVGYEINLQHVYLIFSSASICKACLVACPVRSSWLHSSILLKPGLTLIYIFKQFWTITSTFFNFKQDTVVGFLMAGVGNVDLRRKTNYLIVDSSMPLNFSVFLLLVIDISIFSLFFFGMTYQWCRGSSPCHIECHLDFHISYQVYFHSS